MKCFNCGTLMRGFRDARPYLESRLAAGPVMADSVAEELGVTAKTARRWLKYLGATAAFRPNHKTGRAPLVWKKGAP